MSTGSHDTLSGDPRDRRITVRRKEDYFWLQRLADLTGEACLVVNRNLDIEYVDEKVFATLNMAPIDIHEFTHLGQLTTVMAEQGYFGRGDPKVFEALISDLLVNQRLKQTTATQIINAVTPTGRHIDIRVSLGRDDSYLLLMRDITTEELKRRALETALQVGQSGYWFYNLNTKEFHLRADSIQKYFSAESFEKIKREGFLDVIHPDDLDRANAAINTSIKTRIPQVLAIRIVGDDGTEIWLKSNIMPNIDEGGRVRSLSCFITNISQQMKIEQDLRTARAEAELSLKAKNEFLGRLSHEVRTPLNAVIGMADALVHNCRDASILPQLSLIQNSAEKVMEMVDGTLEHTKLADDAVELNLRDCSPKALVESIYKKWIDKAEANKTKLSLLVHPDVPETMAFDDYRYEQCLSNLLSNAIKFTPGGQVKIMLATNGKGTNRQVVVAVRDNGIGMTQESLSEIFLPFKQADNSISGRFGGTGLGLSIVKDLVELMGGRINVSSEVGKGTMFAIAMPITAATEEDATPGRRDKPDTARMTAKALPVSAPSTPQAAPITAQITPPQVSNEAPQTKTDQKPTPASENTPQETLSDNQVQKPTEKIAEKTSQYSDLRVLIVDDNATNHIVVSSLLSRVVGEITTALNGQDALDKLQEKEFDVVLMDIHMPVMDGIETTLAIRSEPSSFQNVPIIALTADPQYQQARLCRNIGMNSSLGKPIKLASLLQSFDDVLFSEKSGIASAA